MRRRLHLFIHRWFGGSYHIDLRFIGKRISYPRLANWIKLFFFPAAIFAGIYHNYDYAWADTLSTVFIYLFCSLGIPYLYMFYNPISLTDWWKVYHPIWSKRGFYIFRGDGVMNEKEERIWIIQYRTYINSPRKRYLMNSSKELFGTYEYAIETIKRFIYPHS